jgi:methanogenic corrinoid protein MtbC1
MVGGPVFVAKPELARRVGADATAADARGAVTQAERLLDLLVVQR